MLGRGFPFFISVLLVLLCSCAQASDELVLEGYCNDQGSPRLEYKVPSDATEVELYRSTSNLADCTDPRVYPIVCYTMPPETRVYDDYFAPQDVTVYYQLRVNFQNRPSIRSGVVAVETPAPPNVSLSYPYLMVDKLSYTMFLMDNGEMVRRFPIALGQNPTNRKLHQDRASTPEGLYRIINLQPRATYYRAYDLNYPNTVDRERYDLFAELGLLPWPQPDIGGEIQIHGEGIYQNWTWGCIALRNTDMDWLFSRPELRTGIEVLIAGSELTMEDLEAIAAISYTEQLATTQQLKRLGIEDHNFHQAVGRFQHQCRIPITGQLDLRTKERLRRTFGAR